MVADTKNPANKSVEVPAERKRIPMSSRQAMLATSPIPGYRQYWFVERNVERAKLAGYEFVDEKEVILNQANSAMDTQISGNSDMGSNVSVVGGVGNDGKPERLILMKIKEEWFEEDQRAIAARNADVMKAIFKEDKVLHDPQAIASDKEQVYVKRALFNRALKRQN